MFLVNFFSQCSETLWDSMSQLKGPHNVQKTVEMSRNGQLPSKVQWSNVTWRSNVHSPMSLSDVHKANKQKSELKLVKTNDKQAMRCLLSMA